MKLLGKRVHLISGASQTIDRSMQLGKSNATFAAAFASNKLKMLSKCLRQQSGDYAPTSRHANRLAPARTINVLAVLCSGSFANVSELRLRAR